MKTNVTYLSKKYSVNEAKKVVHCRLQFAINLDNVKDFANILEFENAEDYFNKVYERLGAEWCPDVDLENGEGQFSTSGYIVMSVGAIARCNDADTFDEDLGKKIALTKAQQKAFFKAMKLYDSVYEFLVSTAHYYDELVCNATLAANDCCNHVDELSGLADPDLEKNKH